MGGFDDNAAILGDWGLPSPSPRTFFASMLDDDICENSTSESAIENNNKMMFFSGIEEQNGFRKADEKCEAQVADQSTKFSSFSEQNSSSRGGLLERMAARAGFNAPRLNTESIRPANLSANPDIRSPYLTISPGVSLATLLESPVFLSNSLVQPSPTTGKFPFTMNGHGRTSTMFTEGADKSRDSFFDYLNPSSAFAFKPIAESGPSSFFGTASKMPPSTLSQQQPFPSVDVSIQAEEPRLSERIPPTNNFHSRNGNAVLLQTDFSRPFIGGDSGVSTTIMSVPRPSDTIGGGGTEHSSPLDEQQEEEADQRGSGDTTVGGGASSEDGYNWRKYGQKQVKGSEFPRSYYKCTHPNCPVKKKVERSHEGHITEIIYKGAHNHHKPPPNRRSAVGSSNLLNDAQIDVSDQTGGQNGAESDPMWTTMQKGPDRRQDNLEVTSSVSGGPEYCNVSSSLRAQNGTTHSEAGDAVDGSSTFSNDEDEDDRGTHGSVSLGYDGEGDESESKRRKVEAYAAEMSGATRAIREPRVVVQTTSEVDILDDGYRWRKYGQKVVKGNPNPRSYYKCTSPGCTVRKHVERASHDLKSVITTYEGKHNHDVPAARNSSHVNNAPSNSVIASQAAAAAGSSIQNHLHRPEPSQVHNMAAMFDRPHPMLGSYGGPQGRQLLGPAPGFSFGINQAGFANLGMCPSGQGGKMSGLPMHHPYTRQQQSANEMGGFMLPREPKAEQHSETLLNGSSSSAVCSQIMSRLPLGPQM